jgi:F420H(2)-dependent quinone reductase
MVAKFVMGSSSGFVWDGTRMASFLRKPFSALTSLAQPPPPESRRFAVWKRFTGLNNALYRASGGRLLGSYDGNPVLLLHHVGRRSGEERVTPLLYLPDGDDLVIVASMGGTPKHPAWFHNLRDNPDTDVEVGRERRAVRARVADPEERARLWPRLVEHYPAFASYQARTEREIPVVILSSQG